MSRHERLLLEGTDGRIETFVEAREEATGIALVAHPHPLFGGTAENKVVTTLSRSLRELGCATLRPNFRGVGASEGAFDGGQRETEDLARVLAWGRERFGRQLPVYLAGFSFGAYVATRLAKQLAAAGDPARRLILVGTAAGFVDGSRRYELDAVAEDTIVIHGGADETVPLANVLQWAQSLDLPVTVVAGADHFFHRRLHLIRRIIHSAWKP